MYPFAIQHKKSTLAEFLKLLVIRFLFHAGSVILLLFQHVLYKKNHHPRKILVFRTGTLGDIICAAPSFAAIKKAYPHATLDILTNSGKPGIPGLDKLLNPGMYHAIIDYSGIGKRELISLLKANNYDLVIQLPQTDAPFNRLLRDLLFFRNIAPAGWGWQFSTVRIFKRTQEKFLVFPNETERLAAIVENNGIPVDRNAFELNFIEEDANTLQRLFIQEGLAGERKNIAMVVGAKRAQNRWPITNFRKVIESLGSNFNFILVGSSDDRELTATLRVLPHVYDFCGRLTPVQSAILFGKCAVVLSNDTGPMHLAYSVGTPLVALFSSRDFPGKWYPPSSEINHVFRTENVHCSLCLSDHCSNNICMQAIEPGKVTSKLIDLLSLSAGTAA